MKIAYHIGQNAFIPVPGDTKFPPGFTICDDTWVALYRDLGEGMRGIPCGADGDEPMERAIRAFDAALRRPAAPELRHGVPTSPPGSADAQAMAQAIAHKREQERALLLATARVLRAHLRDHATDHADVRAMDEALAPFDPAPGHGGDFERAGDAAKPLGRAPFNPKAKGDPWGPFRPPSGLTSVNDPAPINRHAQGESS